MSSEVELKKKSFIRRWGKTIVYWANIFAASALLLSYLAPYISPENFWYIAFLGLAYPFLLAANILFILFWIFFKKRIALISFICIVIGFNQVRTLFTVSFKSTFPDKAKTSFNIMSYNVRLFDLYNWTKNKETRNKIFDLLVDEAPDIICFQEFYRDEVHYFETRDTLVKIQKAINVHEEYPYNYYSEKINLHIGLATFSKFPIVGKGVVPFPEKNNNICIYTDIKVGEDTIRIYNMHLQSIHFSNSDYKFVEEVFTEKEAEQEVQKSKKIFNRLKKAFQKRAAQANAVAEHIKNTKHKVVVCGDFNDTPSSYTYATISKGLKDSFVESGIGFGKSYSGKFPSFRIDYILHDKNLNSSNFKITREELSDHFPIAATIYY